MLHLSAGDRPGVAQVFETFCASRHALQRAREGETYAFHNANCLVQRDYILRSHIEYATRLLFKNATYGARQIGHAEKLENGIMPRKRGNQVMREQAGRKCGALCDGAWPQDR